MNELPQGWANAALDDIAIVNPGRIEGLVAGTSVSFVPMPAVSDVDGEIVNPTVRPFAEVSKGYTQFQEGDVIFAKITPCMENGKIAVARSLENGVACGSTEFHVVRPLGQNSPEYIWRFLRQSSYRADAETVMTGAVGQRRVPAAHLKESRMPLPPLPEQRRIVAKINSLTGKSRRARDHLDHIPRLVEKYKQALLAAAFRGDLTRAWRMGHRPATLSLAQLVSEREQLLKKRQQRVGTCDVTGIAVAEQPFELPQTWRWVRAEAICGFITKGTTPPSATMSSGHGEIPYIKVYNLTFDGALEFTTDPTYISREIHDGPLARSKVFPGDVLMNIVGPPLGKVSIVTSEHAEWNINQAIAVFRPVKSVSTAFLTKWLCTDVVTRWALSRSKATAGQRNLTLEICRDLPVPLCSFEEQREILLRVESAMTWIDRLASEATSARELIDRLDQAVLAKAFRGELVPQDPSDEPASVLLERIRAERKTTSKPKSKRRSN